jgi:hypothetical protein
LPKGPHVLRNQQKVPHSTIGCVTRRPTVPTMGNQPLCMNNRPSQSPHTVHCFLRLLNAARHTVSALTFGVLRLTATSRLPQRGHSAQTRAGVLLHEQDSEPAEREIRKKQLDSAVYMAILLWHRACHRFSASSGSKTEWGHFTEFNNLPTRCLHTVAQAWMGLLLGKLR